MIDNLYAIEILAHQQLRETERWAERMREIAVARGPRRPLRAVVGEALVQLGLAIRAGVEPKPIARSGAHLAR